MTFANWCLFLGVLLLIMSISDSLLKKIPFSSAAVYMILGVAAGPYGLKLLDLSMNIHDDAHLLEIMTEVVVLVSLFAVGLKLPVRSSHTPWKVPILLATVAMVITIGLTAAVGMALGWSLAISLLGWIDIQPDEDGREQDAREEVGGLTVVARGHAAPLLQACEATLDAIAQAVLGPVVGARLLATARRDDHLGPLGLDRFDQGAAVVALVS